MVKMGCLEIIASHNYQEMRLIKGTARQLIINVFLNQIYLV